MALNLFFKKKECWKTTILFKFLCLLTFILIILVPYKFWLSIMYEIVVIDRKIEKVDAIILEGGWMESEHLKFAAEYIKNGYAELIFTTGPKIETRYQNHFGNKTRATWFKEELVKLGVDESNIIPIEQKRRGTYIEANASMPLFEKYEIRSAIIITEPSHQLRSFMTYKKIYRGKDMKFFVTSIEPSWFSEDNWWKSHNGIQALYGEYMALIYYFVYGYI